MNESTVTSMVAVIGHLEELRENLVMSDEQKRREEIDFSYPFRGILDCRNIENWCTMKFSRNIREPNKTRIVGRGSAHSCYECFLEIDIELGKNVQVALGEKRCAPRGEIADTIHDRWALAPKELTKTLMTPTIDVDTTMIFQHHQHLFLWWNSKYYIQWN